MSGKSRKETKVKAEIKKQLAIDQGYTILCDHPIFRYLSHDYFISFENKDRLGKETAAISDGKGHIYLNKDYSLTPQEWAFTIAHCMLHNVFGHFDAEKMPGYEKKNDEGKCKHIVSCDFDLWNMACDIYVAKFLMDIKLGSPTCDIATIEAFAVADSDELKIYENLRIQHSGEITFTCGTGSLYTRDMWGLENPIAYGKDEENTFAETFAWALACSVEWAVSKAGGDRIERKKHSPAHEQAEWFVNHYPLLGALAAAFDIVYDARECLKYDIDVAAVDVISSVIYANPAARLSPMEMRFVLAHEFLHAGLCHHERRCGRDSFLWNVACDFVINAWLKEMQVGQMPQKGLLYDEQFKGASAEEIYDRIIGDIKKYSKMSGFRGVGLGDIMGDGAAFGENKNATSLDDFYKSALQNGLEYHRSHGRGLIPAGLAEEIRALAMPPIPWNAKLADWFDVTFKPMEKHRSYARPSRRQGATPDIPRPGWRPADIPEYSRTFGVVIDTSGSMSAKMIGFALGAIASYSAAKDVPYARVVFCDASAYDAGYMSPEEIAGRVEVIGRGGTVLQPGVDLLVNAKDFPKEAPILIITDGDIEDDLSVGREHAFLIPQGKHLPFKAAGQVFRFSE